MPTISLALTSSGEARTSHEDLWIDRLVEGTVPGYALGADEAETMDTRQEIEHAEPRGTEGADPDGHERVLRANARTRRIVADIERLPHPPRR